MIENWNMTALIREDEQMAGTHEREKNPSVWIKRQIDNFDADPGAQSKSQ